MKKKIQSNLDGAEFGKQAGETENRMKYYFMEVN